MGVRIDLPIHDLEEANFLDRVLLDAAEHRKALRRAKLATPEERARYDREYELALRLRERMVRP
jgi:hypothetical protein